MGALNETDAAPTLQPTPYPSGSAEEQAYRIGLKAHIPPPDVVLNRALLRAYDRGLDEWDRVRRGRGL